MKLPSDKERRDVLETYPGTYYKRKYKDCPVCGKHLKAATGIEGCQFCPECAYA